MKTELLVTVDHSHPMPDLADLVSARAWSLAGVNSVEGRLAAQASRKLTEPEIKALTAMVWGAPCFGRDLAIVISTVRAMEALRPGERPIDPADGGRLLDVDACIVEPAAALATEGQTP